MATNLLSTFYAIRSEIPMMRAQGAGAIVNVGSTASLQGYATLGGYTASKHGVLGLTRSVALENADVPIRCNCICPGPVDTPLMRGIEELVNPENPAAAHAMFAGTTALKRYGMPEESPSWCCSCCGSSRPTSRDRDLGRWRCDDRRRLSAAP